MKITKTDFEDLFILEPNKYTDSRGYFFESFNSDFFNKNKLDYNFIQDNESLSFKNVLRGMHLQLPPYSQTKLVRVVKGEVQDVVIDLRTDSKMYGKYFSVNLSSENKKQLLIPKGFAHGFLVISDYVIFAYKVDCKYSMNHESGIHWNDKNLNIKWQAKSQDIICSEKDFELPSFDEFNLKYN